MRDRILSGLAAAVCAARLTQDEGSFVAVVIPGLQGQGSALRETWKRTGDGWKLKSVQEITAPSTVARKN